MKSGLASSFLQNFNNKKSLFYCYSSYDGYQYLVHTTLDVFRNAESVLLHQRIYAVSGGTNM
jgi:hypothetical protein